MADRRLVTGGGGFIGSNLVRALLERGAAVRAMGTEHATPRA